ncbi:hypothetical protein CRUP_014168 [Coryphaenoides rupestris]|nr:hypothetical protein CRUP_014168 [Coryphaenoides rupestris]
MSSPPNPAVQMLSATGLRCVSSAYVAGDRGGGRSLAALDASGLHLLHHAVAAGYKEAVRYLLDHGESRLTDAQPGRGRSLVTNSREPQRGETALHRAATLCQRTICHYLVEAGASLMKTDLQHNDGETSINTP